MTNSKELVVLSIFLYKNLYYFCHETSESSKQKFKRKVKKRFPSENSDRFLDIPFIQK